MHARVVLCGAISSYNAQEPKGPRNYMNLLVRRSRMEGFVVFDYFPRTNEAMAELVPLVMEGKIRGFRFPTLSEQQLRELSFSENAGLVSNGSSLQLQPSYAGLWMQSSSQATLTGGRVERNYNDGITLQDSARLTATEALEAPMRLNP